MCSTQCLSVHFYFNSAELSEHDSFYRGVLLLSGEISSGPPMVLPFSFCNRKKFFINLENEIDLHLMPFS